MCSRCGRTFYSDSSFVHQPTTSAINAIQAYIFIFAGFEAFGFLDFCNKCIFNGIWRLSSSGSRPTDFARRYTAETTYESGRIVRSWRRARNARWSGASHSGSPNCLSEAPCNRRPMSQKIIRIQQTKQKCRQSFYRFCRKIFYSFSFYGDQSKTFFKLFRYFRIRFGCDDHVLISITGRSDVYVVDVFTSDKYLPRARWKSQISVIFILFKTRHSDSCYLSCAEKSSNTFRKRAHTHRAKYRSYLVSRTQKKNFLVYIFFSFFFRQKKKRTNGKSVF